MDFFMGLKGKDFVVVCSDMAATQSIIRMKSDEDKIVSIDDHKVFALSGKLAHCKFQNFLTLPRNL